jgi:Zn-dependent peptidase ImmA (M78 family)
VEKLRASYFADDEPAVMNKRSLPREPKLFALVHELKHHYVDREHILGGKHDCGNYNENEQIEIGAEVFAAQFIYPEDEMRIALQDFGAQIGKCTPETIVHFKQVCVAIVSYTFLAKRFERFGLIERGICAKTRFKKLEEELLGTPFYKRPGYWDRRKQIH